MSISLNITAISLFAGAVHAGVPTYDTFELQARSNIVDGFNLPANSSFNSKTPSLNDDSTIAFTLIVVGGADTPGLFIGSGGIGSVVHTGPSGRLFGDPSINNPGEVAFEQSDLFTDGIFVYDPDLGSASLVVAPAGFSSVGGEAINDSSQIGFRAGSPNTWRVFDDGSSTTYVTQSGSVAFLFTPSFNNSGHIAGKVRRGTTDNSSPDEIRLYTGAGASTILERDQDGNPASPFSSFDNSLWLNNNGTVAFIASLVAGGRGVFLTDGTTTTTIATEDDPDIQEIVFFPPASNDDGLVAFRGVDGDGNDAIFVGDGTTLDRVVGETDQLEIDLGTAQIAQHDSSPTFGGSIAMNIHGDIAFNASLTPAGNDQIEWGSGMFIAYAGGDDVLGDTDGDGDVDVDDLVAVIIDWGTDGSANNGDIDGSGLVDVDDLVAVILNWT